jgi:hydroxyethylthiazole kinase-like sugar kinase family protein
MAAEMSKKCVDHWALMKKNRPLIMCVTNKVTPQVHAPLPAL